LFYKTKRVMTPIRLRIGILLKILLIILMKNFLLLWVFRSLNKPLMKYMPQSLLIKKDRKWVYFPRNKSFICYLKGIQEQEKLLWLVNLPKFITIWISCLKDILSKRSEQIW